MLYYFHNDKPPGILHWLNQYHNPLDNFDCRYDSWLFFHYLQACPAWQPAGRHVTTGDQMQQCMKNDHQCIIAAACQSPAASVQSPASACRHSSHSICCCRSALARASMANYGAWLTRMSCPLQQYRELCHRRRFQMCLQTLQPDAAPGILSPWIV